MISKSDVSESESWSFSGCGSSFGATDGEEAVHRRIVEREREKEGDESMLSQ